MVELFSFILEKDVLDFSFKNMMKVSDNLLKK